jgi:hypothetical protein
MTIAIEVPEDVALSESEVRMVPESLPDHFEVVNGQIVETPYMSDYAVEVAHRFRRAVDATWTRTISGNRASRDFTASPSPTMAAGIAGRTDRTFPTSGGRRIIRIPIGVTLATWFRISRPRWSARAIMPTN